jgi:two-component system sensor histidine kinase QseC
MDSMQVSVWQLQQTVELLLASARETPVELARTSSEPLLPVVERLVLAHAPLLEQQRVELEIDVPPGLTRPWPPALTQVLLGNLLANSIAHAHTPKIWIHADAMRLSVCNASSPPPDALLGDGVAGRDRGVKGPASTGNGLGLSIVRQLAERHGLALDLSHRDGRTCATLRETKTQGLAIGAAGEP